MCVYTCADWRGKGSDGGKGWKGAVPSRRALYHPEGPTTCKHSHARARMCSHGSSSHHFFHPAPYRVIVLNSIGCSVKEVRGLGALLNINFKAEGFVGLYEVTLIR
jgi:hypothetical protein